MQRTRRAPRHAPREISNENLPPALRAYGCKVYRLGECSVIVGHEPMGFQTSPIEAPTAPLRHHLSIAHPTRYPTWDEIADAREALLPKELTFAQILPASWDFYVNQHPNCFHLWEVHDRDG